MPVLRFKEFENEWEVKKLENVIFFQSGYAFKSSEMLNAKAKYQLIKMSNVYQNQLRLDRNPSFWNVLESKQKKFLLKKGDTILTLTGTVGKRDYGYSIIIEEDDKFLLNQRLLLLREKKSKSHNYFINYLVSTSRFLYYFFSNSKGGTGNQSNVGVEDLKAIKLPLPTVPEQQKIANFLTATDTKIQQLRQKKGLLNDYKKGVMQQIFKQEIRFKNDDGGDFEDWEVKKLGEVAKIYQPKTISQSDLTKEGYDVYGANGIIGKFSEYNHLLEQIVVTCRGSTCGTVNFTNPKSWITGNAMVINIDNNRKIDKRFLSFLLSNTNFTYLITGSGQPQITGDIKKHKSLFPTLPEQQKIANFLSSIDERIGKVSVEIGEMERYKKGLLQGMFV